MKKLLFIVTSLLISLNANAGLISPSKSLEHAGSFEFPEFSSKEAWYYDSGLSYFSSLIYELGISNYAEDSIERFSKGYNESLQKDSDVALTSAAVPEPGSIALLSFGLLGLGIARRKQKNQDSVKSSHNISD